MKMGSKATIEVAFSTCTDKQEKRQLAYMLARQGIALDLENGACAGDLRSPILSEALFRLLVLEENLQPRVTVLVL